MSAVRWNWILIVAGLLTGPAPAGAAQDYAQVVLAKDGSAKPEALERMSREVRGKLPKSGGHIAVLVHGFGQQVEVCSGLYAEAARKLKEGAESLGFPLAVVGVHWDSDAGSMDEWMLKSAGARLTSLLGLKHAVRSPYLAKTALSREVGRSGLRSVFFRLEDDFPGVPLHCITHSLGAEAVVTALAPEGRRAAKDSLPVVSPERTLRLDLVAMTGADLDCDLFVRKNRRIRNALGRVDRWWVTVPRPNHADAVLELRRGAGKTEAVGNRGLLLRPEDREALEKRGGLVVDQDGVPPTHDLDRYLNRERLERLAAAMQSLER